VAGNEIGTDVTGTQPLGNGFGVGIYAGANNNVIGGADPGSGNVISANSNFGVLIFNPDATGNVLKDNFIGTDVSGTQPLGNGVDGVNIQDSASGNGVFGNTIGYNGNDGVSVDQGTGNAIQQNSIGNDGNLGIELTNGGNNQEAAPEIIAANTDGSNVFVQGDLNSLPDTEFTLEFFANTGTNSAGFGEGQQYLGTITITTDDNGLVDFDASFAASVDVSEGLTATVTDTDGNTSQFSSYFALSGPRTPVSPIVGQANPFTSESRTSAPIPLNPPQDMHASVDQFFLAQQKENALYNVLFAKARVPAPASILGLDDFATGDGPRVSCC
jgi:hypothetical protein